MAAAAAPASVALAMPTVDGSDHDSAESPGTALPPLAAAPHLGASRQRRRGLPAAPRWPCQPPRYRHDSAESSDLRPHGCRFGACQQRARDDEIAPRSSGRRPGQRRAATRGSAWARHSSGLDRRLLPAAVRSGRVHGSGHHDRGTAPVGGAEPEAVAARGANRSAASGHGCLRRVSRAVEPASLGRGAAETRAHLRRSPRSKALSDAFSKSSTHGACAGRAFAAHVCLGARRSRFVRSDDPSGFARSSTITDEQHEWTEPSWTVARHHTHTTHRGTGRAGAAGPDAHSSWTLRAQRRGVAAPRRARRTCRSERRCRGDRFTE